MSDTPAFLNRRYGDSTSPILRPPSTQARPRPDWCLALLEGLTPPQKEAVLCTEGPLLVLAAAGSGKTRVITRRIAYLISCGVPAWQILALTFTNKAAGEMRERVHKILGDQVPSRGLTITTFHSLCARLLRRYAQPAGLKPDFSIYDSSDQSALCKKVIESLQLSTSNFPPRSVLSAISNAKNDLKDAAAFAAEAFDFSSKIIAKVYAGYTKALRNANAVDFDDLLLLTAKVLKEDGLAREECQKRWQYLLVDEYQDTNHAQFLIASLIAGEGAPGGQGPNFCVVGDPDQSIYGWRGADISNILDFEEHYPKARTITLGENFRSTAPILKIADTLIRSNKRRKHKDLFTSKQGGEKPEAVLCRDEHHESTLVVDWFKQLHEEEGAREDGTKEQRNEGTQAPSSLPSSLPASFPWRDMAVFYRTNSLSRVMEEALRSAAIPYTIARGTAFYDREEIKTVLAYLRVVANGADGVSLSRIINTPARGISDKTVDSAELFAGQHATTLLDALRQSDQLPGLNARAVASIAKFIETLDGWTGGGKFLYAGTDHGLSLAELVDRVIKESGLEAMYKKQAATSQTETDSERLDNLAEMVSSAREFEFEYDPQADPASDVSPNPQSEIQNPQSPRLLILLRAYLESVALVADADAVDPSQGSVTLMTLHAAKGLEFKAVVMIGMEEGLLPHSRAFDSEADLEEERRLCFVGVTRAMQRLLLTSAKYRTVRGIQERTIPSRFLGEMPHDTLHVSDQSDTLADLGEEWGGSSTEKFDIPGSDHRTLGAPRRHSTPAPGSAGEFPVGAQVRHPQFGIGTIKAIQAGANARATIQFRDVGTKTLVLEYARLTRVN